jgi:hypothetical protein
MPMPKRSSVDKTIKVAQIVRSPAKARYLDAERGQI